MEAKNLITSEALKKGENVLNKHAYTSTLWVSGKIQDNGVDNLIQCDIMRMALNYIKNNHYDLPNNAEEDDRTEIF